MFKSQKGITLVALAVTIVVLLILAGVTIAFVLSDDGVVKSAQDAATANDGAIVAENIQQALVAVQISELAGQITFDDDEGTNGKDVTSEIKAGLGTTGVAISSGTIKIKDDNTVTFNTVKATLDGKTFDVTYTNGRVTAKKAVAGA